MTQHDKLHIKDVYLYTNFYAKILEQRLIKEDVVFKCFCIELIKISLTLSSIKSISNIQKVAKYKFDSTITIMFNTTVHSTH